MVLWLKPILMPSLCPRLPLMRGLMARHTASRMRIMTRAAKAVTITCMFWFRNSMRCLPVGPVGSSSRF